MHSKRPRFIRVAPSVPRIFSGVTPFLNVTVTFLKSVVRPVSSVFAIRRRRRSVAVETATCVSGASAVAPPVARVSVGSGASMPMKDRSAVALSVSGMLNLNSSTRQPSTYSYS